MNKYVSNVVRRTVLSFASFALVLSTVTAAVPVFLTQTVSAVSAAVYTGIPAGYTPTFPSQPFQAQQTREFGDHISLAGTNRKLNTVTVSLTDWACENDYTKVNPSDPCVTTSGSSFSHPITLNIYAVTPTGKKGNLLASKKQAINVLYRPSADPVNCAGAITKWYDTATDQCYNGVATNAEFDMTSTSTVLPDEIIVGIAYNTQTYGLSPIGLPGPYDSLNVSLATSAPTVGVDADKDVMFINSITPTVYTDKGAGGTGTFRADTGWSGYSLAININAVPADTTPPVAVITSPTGAVNGTTLTIKGSVSDDTALSHYYCYVTLPGSSEVGTRGADCNTTWHSVNNGTLGTVDIAGLADGNYEAHLIAKDKAGNYSNLNYAVPFVLDNTAPTSAPVITNSPVSLSAAELSKQATWTYGGTDFDHFEYREYIDAAAAATDSAYWTQNIAKDKFSQTVGQSWGTHTLYYRVVAVDAAGNRSAQSELGMVVIDREAPTVPIPSAIVGKTTGDKVVTLEGQATDAAFNYYYCFVTNAQGEVGNRDSLCQTAWAAGSPFKTAFAPSVDGQSGGLLGTITLPGTLPSGDYTAHVIAFDKVGNSTEATKVFTLDNTAPAALINIVATDKTQPTISGTLSGTDVDAFTVKLDGVKLNTSRIGEDWSALVTTPLSYSTHTVLVEGTDLAGNAFTTTQQFTTVAPVIVPVIVPTPTAQVAPVAPIVGAAPYATVAPAAVAATTTDGEVLGASTTKADAPAVAGAQTSKDVAAEPTAKNGFNSAWYWLLAILVAGFAWWAIAAFRRRES